MSPDVSTVAANPILGDFAPTYVLRGSFVAAFSDDNFYELCQSNPDLRMERTATHEIIIMPPVGGHSGAVNGDAYFQLALWSRAHGGRAFESSVGFRLPDGAILSPDASWLRAEVWNHLTPTQRQKFLLLCPEFVMEVKSPSDRLATLQAKMEQWLRNGAQLGFLLDTETETAYVYRPDHAVETVQGFDHELSGEPVLPGFRLDLRELRPQS